MLDSLLSGGEGDKWKARQEVFSKLFETKDSDLILTITDLSPNDLEWATALELLYSLLVTPYITDEDILSNLYKLKDRIYLLRISKERKGRTEGFQFFTEQTRAEGLESIGGRLPGLK